MKYILILALFVTACGDVIYAGDEDAAATECATHSGLWYFETSNTDRGNTRWTYHLHITCRDNTRITLMRPQQRT